MEYEASFQLEQWLQMARQN